MASIKRRADRGNKWQARYRDPAGREHARLFDRKIDAEHWLDGIRGDMVRGSYIDPAAGRITLNELAGDWLSLAVWREGTRLSVQATLRHVLPILGPRPLAAIRRSDIQALLNGLDLAPSTVATVHQHLRTMLGVAVEDGRIAKNPAVGIKLPEVISPPVVPLTAEQVWALAEAATAPFRAAVMVGAGLGLRQGEAMGLCVDQVDFLRRRVRVDRQRLTPGAGPSFLGPPKTRAAFRAVPASDVVLEALSAHLAAHGTGSAQDAAGKIVDGLVFHVAGGPVGRNRFGDLWRATVKRAGLPLGTRYHDLRHHFASALIATGCSIKAVQEALGHASAKETLDTYSHLWPDDHDRIRGAVQSTLRPALADQARTSEGHDR